MKNMRITNSITALINSVFGIEENKTEKFINTSSQILEFDWSEGVD